MNENQNQIPTLDAFPDTLDFRDKIYEPTLIEVPAQVDLMLMAD
jgi:hypothetical protein